MKSQDAVMAIAGEFNYWVPQNMQREGDSFACNLNLIKGYSYRYCFIDRDAPDSPIIDQSLPSSSTNRILPFGLTKTNCLEVQDD